MVTTQKTNKPHIAVLSQPIRVLVKSVRKCMQMATPFLNGSQRNVPVLLRRVRVALVLEQRERSDQFGSGLRRFNYFINEATFSGDVRIGELFFELIHARSAGRRFI